MVEADRKEFGASLAAVYALYRVDLSQAVVGIWWQALRLFDLAAVKEAFGRHAVNPDTGQFVPKPADVVRMMEGSTQDAALQAWSKLERAIGYVGGWETVAFDDALVHVVLEEMGGWIGLCGVRADELPFKRQEFVNRYRGYRARSQTPAHPPTLIGRFDLQNVAQGYDDQPVMLIGDQARARDVIRAGTQQSRLTLGTTRSGVRAIAQMIDQRKVPA